MIYHFHTCGFAGNNTSLFFKAPLSRTDSLFTALALTSASVLLCKVAFLSEVGGLLSSWYLLCNIWAQLFACWTAEIFATCQCLSILKITHELLTISWKGQELPFFSVFDTSVMLGIPNNELLSSTIIKKKSKTKWKNLALYFLTSIKEIAFLTLFWWTGRFGVCVHIHIYMYRDIWKYTYLCTSWESLLGAITIWGLDSDNKAFSFRQQDTWKPLDVYILVPWTVKDDFGIWNSCYLGVAGNTSYSTTNQPKVWERHHKEEKQLI